MASSEPSTTPKDAHSGPDITESELSSCPGSEVFDFDSESSDDFIPGAEDWYHGREIKLEEEPDLTSPPLSPDRKQRTPIKTRSSPRFAAGFTGNYYYNIKKTENSPASAVGLRSPISPESGSTITLGFGGEMVGTKRKRSGSSDRKFLMTPAPDKNMASRKHEADHDEEGGGDLSLVPYTGRSVRFRLEKESGDLAVGKEHQGRLMAEKEIIPVTPLRSASVQLLIPFTALSSEPLITQASERIPKPIQAVAQVSALVPQKERSQTPSQVPTQAPGSVLFTPRPSAVQLIPAPAEVLAAAQRLTQPAVPKTVVNLIKTLDHAQGSVPRTSLAASPEPVVTPTRAQVNVPAAASWPLQTPARSPSPVPRTSLMTCMELDVQPVQTAVQDPFSEPVRALTDKSSPSVAAEFPLLAQATSAVDECTPITTLDANTYVRMMGMVETPKVHVLVKSGDEIEKSYHISQEALCAQSRYFRDIIPQVGSLGLVPTLILEDVRPEVFNMAVQWIFTGNINPPTLKENSKSVTSETTDLITTYLELAIVSERLGLFTSLVPHVRNCLSEIFKNGTLALTSAHITAAVRNPHLGLVRELFAELLAIEYYDFTQTDEQVFRFQAELHFVEGFAADVLTMFGKLVHEKSRS